MNIKKKYMSKENWSRVIERRYICRQLDESVKGNVSLLHIKKVTEPCYKKYGNNVKLKIADENFYWLQIGIENENYWITAMYDNNKKIIQYYIDITERNILKNEADSYFYDLFLDIVLLKDNNMILLDEDELQKALTEGNIDQEQYDFAYEIANKLIDNLPDKKNLLESFCEKYLKILLKELEKEEKK